MAAPSLSDTARKVDRALARLDELQCIIRSGRGPACLSTTRRPKLSLHAGDRRRHGALGSPANPPPPPPSRRCQPSPPFATPRRRARVSACPPPPRQPTLPASTPSPSLSPPGRVLSSPPSSACSSSVVVRTKGPPTSKLPRTFFVDARPANANRPWRLSSSPSPRTTAAATTTTTTTTSNYIYTPSTNSTASVSAARPIKSPSRFSPLHRQASKCNAHQTQPLLDKGPDLHHHQQHSRSIAAKPKASPTRQRRPKTAWFSQTRLSLPTLTPPSSTKPTRRLSLVTKEHRNSPPRPLPALLTRLPTRRKKTTPPNAMPAFTNEGQTPSHSTPKASPRKSPTIAIRPLPLPPALQAAAISTTQALQATKNKACNKRSTSCPRQRLLPLDANTTSSSSPALSNPKKQSCFSCTGKENCFSGGCNLAVWPALRRSWSCSQQHSLDHSDITGSGSYVLKHVKGHMNRDKNLSSQVYKVDSFKQELARDKPRLYVG